MRLMLSTLASHAAHSAVHVIFVPAHLACLQATPATVWPFVLVCKVRYQEPSAGCGAAQ